MFVRTEINIIFFLATLTSLLFTETSEIVRFKTPRKVTTSLIIPCVSRHCTKLINTLNFYKKQTVFPDEVIISLGPKKAIPENFFSKVQLLKLPFECNFLLNNGVNAAKNRNLASSRAKSDILIYQDADDAPHPQRVEVIKYIFENFDIDYLVHDYITTLYNGQGKVKKIPYSKHRVPRKNFFKKIILNDLKIEHIRDFNNNNGANGVISITSKVFQNLKWDEQIPYGEDCEYGKRIFRMFKKRALLKFPIYEYLPVRGVSI